MSSSLRRYNFEHSTPTMILAMGEAAGSLIVDVPHRRRRHSWSWLSSSVAPEDDMACSAGIVKAEDRQPKAKSVSFSPTSEMVLFPCKSKTELGLTWYSKEEKTQLKEQLLQSAAQVTRILDERPDQLTEADLCETVGMEIYLNPRLYRISKLQKKKHAQTLVCAQDRCDPALLAKLSEQSSSRSRERAHQRALNQFWLKISCINFSHFPSCKLNTQF